MFGQTTPFIDQASFSDSANGESEIESDSDEFLVDEQSSSSGSGPIEIVKISNNTNGEGNSRIKLNEKALSSLLLQDSVRNKPVVIVSIAGDLRKGKSFMLNFFLRYLKSGAGESPEWIGDDQAPLEGFSWKNGCTSDTTGILLWSEPLFFKLDNGKEVAVFLMDTQGSFDNESSLTETAIIFALSTLISSIQVYNVKDQLQLDKLQNLEIFSEYGRLAQQESEIDRPFQKLVFLIRDWSSPWEYPYGAEGGNAYLRKHLKVSGGITDSQRNMRERIKSYYSEMECFLMPDPGKKVTTSQYFDGKICDIDTQFMENLKIFVPSILNKNKLITKKINGQQVSGRILLASIKRYFEIFKTGKLPEPMTIFEATAEITNLVAIDSAKALYLTEMKILCDANILEIDTLNEEHTRLMNESIQSFDQAKKIGSIEICSIYRQKLCDSLNQYYLEFLKANQLKKSNRNRTLLKGIGAGFAGTIAFPAVLAACLIFLRN